MTKKCLQMYKDKNVQGMPEIPAHDPFPTFPAIADIPFNRFSALLSLPADWQIQLIWADNAAGWPEHRHAISLCAGDLAAAAAWAL